jgi:hypothetical protein
MAPTYSTPPTHPTSPYIPDERPPAVPGYRFASLPLHERRRDGSSTDGSSAAGWTGGAVVLMIGALFLARNLGVTDLTGNWWAWLLLIPTAAAAGTALSRYTAAGGRVTAAVITPTATGAALAGLTAAFLLGLDWQRFTPVLLLVTGAALLARQARR